MKWTLAIFACLAAAPAFAYECRVDLVSGREGYIESFLGYNVNHDFACRQAMNDCHEKLDYYRNLGQYPYSRCQYVQNGPAPLPYPPSPFPGPQPEPYPYPSLSWYTVECSSRHGAFAECYAGGNIREIHLQEQFSNAPCIENVSFGIRHDQVWVDHGCRGRFSVGVLRGRFH